MKYMPHLNAFMFMIFKGSCLGINVVLYFLSPPIKAQVDSIDFYLEHKALDPAVDRLKHTKSSHSLK